MKMKTGRSIDKKIKKLPSVEVLGVRVDDVSKKQAVEAAIGMANSAQRGNYIVTVNPEFVMMAHRSDKFARILANSNLSVADGVGVAISKLILGGREQDRITGVDLIENVCKIASEKVIRIGFLGGFGSVAERVAQRQSRKHPGLQVVLARPGEPTIRYDLRLKRELERVGRIDVLFVAYGMGKQEFWIDRFRQKLDIGLYIGVGGAFDYLADEKKRAPKFLQQIGLEWLWRLFFDPARIWRMRVLPVFAILVFKEFLKKNFPEKIFKI